MLILHLEDETPLRDMLLLALQTLEPAIEVRQFQTPEQALAYIQRALHQIDLFLLDIQLQASMDGIEVAQKIRDLGSNVPIILTSAYGVPSQNVLSLLNCDWIPKPWSLSKVTGKIIPIVRESYNNRASRPASGDDHRTVYRDLNQGGRTREIPTDTIRKVVSAHDSTHDPLGKHRELMLVIRGMIEQRSITNDFSVIVGRSDPNKNYTPDIDLSLYAAPESGVSRMHIRLHVEGENLFVTDLTSTNGTYLGGRRLEPNKPTPIFKGDELMIGQLSVKVLFR